MENVADALKMAGAVLIFVLALSIIILYFGEARQASDTILSYKDRETIYIDDNSYYETEGTARTVGLETIIPSIYRAYLEEYKIVFDFGDGAEPIYKTKDGQQKFSLGSDDKDFSLGDNELKKEFLSAILYRDLKNGEQQFKKKFTSIELTGDSLYKRLSSASKITEYLGVYYKDDSPDIPEVMKVEKRIITYVVE